MDAYQRLFGVRLGYWKQDNMVCMLIYSKSLGHELMGHLEEFEDFHKLQRDPMISEFCRFASLLSPEEPAPLTAFTRSMNFSKRFMRVDPVGIVPPMTASTPVPVSDSRTVPTSNAGHSSFNPITALTSTSINPIPTAHIPESPIRTTVLYHKVEFPLPIRFQHLHRPVPPQLHRSVHLQPQPQ